MSIDERLKRILKEREEVGLLRLLPYNQHLVDFCSNDYLGFARDFSLKEKVLQRLNSKEIKLGSSGSRLITGNSLFAESLEKKIAHFHEAEAALIFNSGYDANVGFFSCVPKKGDTVIYDELIHASIRDGIRLGFAKSYSFKHNDFEDLKNKINRSEGEVFVVVESVYSMDGDLAPLKEICSLNVNVVVDEAHSAGIFGANGEGLVHELGLQSKVFARLITYGKAFGAHGAAILGSCALKDFLINFARSFIYTTYMSEFSLVAIDQVYKELGNSASRIKQTLALNEYFLEQLSKSNLINKFIKSGSLIHCMILSGNTSCKTLEEKLKNKGISVKAILSPTVPEGLERLRISIHFHNSKKEIDEMLLFLNKSIVFID